MLMKKFSAIGLLLTVCAGASFAQNRSGVGLHASGFDYAGPITGQYLFHERVESEPGVATPSTKKTILWRPGVRLGYFKELNRFFDLNLGLSATNIEIPLSDIDNTYENRVMYNTSARQLYFGGDIRVNFNILDKSRYIVTPYLFGGVTPTYKDDGYGYGYLTASVPLGLGFGFNVGRNIDLQLESGYRVAVTNKEYNHLQHSAGIVFWFVRPKEAPPVVEFVRTDTDKDGIPDDEDQCPTIAGPAEFHGCPDSDGDGVADNVDECPMIAGSAAFNGCPDSDNDGIPDNKDKCPYVAGTADRDGCPAPEVKTEIVREVERAAKAIFFETGKAVLKKESYTQLDIVVGILKDNPELYADIEGHTDNVGSDQLNQKLSDRRAAVVRDYFISKGISADRLTATGFGESRPIATNETAAGRAANRRTVILVRNYQK
jgi:OOP family OmpA-OmpF porin